MANQDDPYAFVGPPQEQPWDKWTPQQRASADKLVQMLDGIKLLKSARGSGVGSEHMKHAEELEARGGLAPEDALLLSRYRMSKMNMGPIPNGQRVHQPESDATINARRDTFFAAPEGDRGGMLAEQKAAGYLTNEGFYDDLTPAHKPPQPEPRIALVPTVGGAAPKNASPAIPTLDASASDDETLSNAQLMMLYKLAGATHK